MRAGPEVIYPATFVIGDWRGLDPPKATDQGPRAAPEPGRGGVLGKPPSGGFVVQHRLVFWDQEQEREFVGRAVWRSSAAAASAMCAFPERSARWNWE